MENTKKNEQWQRLEAVIAMSGMTTNGFARHIGLSRSEILYQVKAGRNCVSRALGRRIVEYFPQVSLSWLMLGEGEMLVRSATEERYVPFYDCDMSLALSGLSRVSPSKIVLPQIGHCDCAVRISDRAMGEVAPEGSVLFLRRVDSVDVVSGGLYVVVTNEFTLLRRVCCVEVQSGGEVSLSLESTAAQCDKMSVAINAVSAIYSVVALLQMF